MVLCPGWDAVDPSPGLALIPALCYGIAMKRLLTLLLVLALSLTLCACGRKRTEPAPADATSEYSGPEAPVPTPLSPPVFRAESIEITPENWDIYFTVAEVPLYMLNPNGGVREVEQNYCVLLRDEFSHRFRDYGDYRVEFEIAFDVYINALDYDKESSLFLHSDDLLYALRATHSCAFTSRALMPGAYGNSYNSYLSGVTPMYENAFFTGSANYTDGVWAGFAVDLNTVELVSVHGTLELN